MPSINVKLLGSGEVFSAIEAETVGELKSAVSEATGIPEDMQCYRSQRATKKGLKNALRRRMGKKQTFLASVADETPLSLLGVAEGDEVAVAGDLDGGVIVLGAFALLAAAVLIGVGVSVWVVSGVAWFVSEGAHLQYEKFKEKKEARQRKKLGHTAERRLSFEELDEMVLEPKLASFYYDGPCKSETSSSHSVDSTDCATPRA